MSEDLARRFHAEMIGVYVKAREECGYTATRFLRMVSENGGLQAARALLAASKISEGFEALWQRGRLDVTVEALVLRAPWKELFTVDELAVASRRLDELGYQPSKS